MTADVESLRDEARTLRDRMGPETPGPVRAQILQAAGTLDLTAATIEASELAALSADAMRDTARWTMLLVFVTAATAVTAVVIALAR